MRRQRILRTALAILTAALAILGVAEPSGWRTEPAAPPPTVQPRVNPTEGTAWFQDGAPLPAGGQPDYDHDIKHIVYEGDLQTLTNHPSGYAVTLPNDMAVELGYSPIFLRADSDHLTVKISREYSPYADVEGYLRDYPNRFVTNAEYRSANGIELLENRWTTINDRRALIIGLARTPAPGSPETQNQYLLAHILTGKQGYLNLYFRTDDLARERPAIDRILASLTTVEMRGKAVYNLRLEPVPGRWNQETATAYAGLRDSTTVKWGFFSPWALTRDYSKVADVERQLGYQFPLLLHYQSLGDPFPTEGMQQAFARGQMVELTMQIAAGANDGEARHNANFEVLDGLRDGEIQAFARAAKAFGHPFLFRLNNEMNSDWTQYGGVMLLNDPDIYIKVWRRIHDIFTAEGVDNVIWVFNPNDGSFPPADWNSDAAYYPGNGYVDMLGVTGYNTGTYFRNVTGERWRSFADIYLPMATRYRPLYGRFPWIISEFACSSVGGDKEQWIKDMFRLLPRIPEIKAAVWWSYFDPDYRPGQKGTPARRYWLDERPEYLRAFRLGLDQQSGGR
jgi:hypothetical protein